MNLSESGAYLGPIKEATDDIDVQLIFSNAGYILTGFFEKWYAADAGSERSRAKTYTDWIFVRRTLEHHLQNIECNSTCAVAITHHFLGQLVRTTNSLFTTHKQRQFRGKHC